MEFKTLTTLFYALPEPPHPPAPTRLYPLPYIVHYLLHLFSHNPSPFIDIDDATLYNLLKDEAYLDLEWSLLKRFMGKEGCKIYSTQRPDGIRLLAVSVGIFRGLLNDIENPPAPYPRPMSLDALPSNNYVFCGATWISPSKYDKLKAQHKRDRDHALFILEGPVIANTFTQNLSITFPTLLVCLDIEAFESNHRQLLEIGIVTLSIQKNPMNGAIYAINQPIAQHFLIQEHAGLFNGRNVANRKHHFAFGVSVEATTYDASRILYSILSYPCTFLIGHNIRSDIEFLKGAGYPIPPHIPLQILDTQSMFAQAMREPTEKSSLEKCMSSLGIHGIHHSGHLHNAGNDAWYTMVVFLLLIGCQPDWQAWYHATLNSKYSVPYRNDHSNPPNRMPPNANHAYVSKRWYA